MRGYYNPRRSAMQVRVTLSLADASALRDVLEGSIGEWAHAEAEGLIRRLVHALDGPLDAAECAPGRPYPGGGFE